MAAICLAAACSPTEQANLPDALLPIMGSGGVGPGSGQNGSGGSGSGGYGTGGSSGPDAGPDVPVVTLSQAGVACGQDSECESGFCVDKVCCGTRCDGICQSCALSGSLGTCLPAEVGTDPRNDCPDEMSGSCGRDGTCDGAGQCRHYPSGTICKAASCTGATLTAASRCGADGCASVDGQPCNPYQCGPTSVCLTTCTADKDCVAPNTCNAGRCGKKPLGDKCAADADCNSAHCAQGVCCGTTCTAMCSSCAVAGSEGRCTLVPTGLDPLNQCTRDDPMTCGQDGFCDGAGACRNHVSGTICRTAACTNNTQTMPATCDGKKACGALVTVPCGNYTCDTNARCKVRCVTAADCLSPSICNAGACGGVTAKYYNDMTLTNLVLTQVEAQINNNWGAGSPAGVPPDMFSARYTATVTPRFSELYTFYLLVDDGARMWVNDAPIIDDWNPHPALEDSGTIMLEANKPATIRVEYFEKMGDAVLVMSWSSASEPKAIVPTDRLTPQ